MNLLLGQCSVEDLSVIELSIWHERFVERLQEQVFAAPIRERVLYFVEQFVEILVPRVHEQIVEAEPDRTVEIPVPQMFKTCSAGADSAPLVHMFGQASEREFAELIGEIDLNHKLLADIKTSLAGANSAPLVHMAGGCDNECDEKLMVEVPVPQVIDH